MLGASRKSALNRVVVLNPKGGSGKSTLATNIAACYASRDIPAAIMDFDPQGSSMAWLARRGPELPEIAGIAGFKQSMQATRSWQLRVPNATQALIVDTPAGLAHDRLRELTSDASSILIPVLPSPMDIHAVSRCVADLLLVAKINRNEQKLAVVANRTRKQTKSFTRLMRFLDSLGIPLIAVLRDSQNYIHAAEQGRGMHDMQPSRVRPDLEHIDKIVAWLDNWQQRRQRGADVANIAGRRSTVAGVLKKSGPHSA